MRFTPLFGAHYTRKFLLDTLEYSSGGSGGAGGTGSTEVDDVLFNHITRNNGAGTGYHWQGIGYFNPHAFVDPSKIDDGLQLRGQDLVKLVKDSGTTAQAAFGFTRGKDLATELVDGIIGFGWQAEAGGNWCSFVKTLPYGTLPVKVDRLVNHSTLPASDAQLLGIVIDSETKTIYWIANNAIVDWFTPAVPLKELSDAPAWRYWVLVDQAEAHFYFQGGGDSHIVNIGAADTGDEIGAAVSKPTVTVVGVTDTQAQFSSSAFIHSLGTAEHLASQWQITLDTDPTFLAPVVDTGWNCSDLTSRIQTGLTPSTDYLVRVRYIADDGTMSPWSDGVAFSTSAGSDPAVDPAWPVCEPGTGTIWTSE